MSKRSVLAIAMLAGLGMAATITLAQPAPGDRLPPREKRTLRAELAKLRAEVELLQLEHESDVDFLKKLMEEMKNSEAMESVKGSAKSRLAEFGASLGKKVDDKDLQDFDKTFAADELTAKAIRPFFDSLKKDFVKKTAELNEKRLDLADLETRYTTAK